MTNKGLFGRTISVLLLLAVLAGCGGGGGKSTGPNPEGTTAAAATAAAGQVAAGPTPTGVPGIPGGTGRAWDPPRNMEPVVRNFLANVPDAWGLFPAQGFAAKKTFLVDVRQPEEYAKGFIEGAVNIPLRELTKNLNALPPQDQPVTVVCDTGSRAAIAMVTLQMLGWKQAKSIYGGLEGWQEAKLPLVTGPVQKRPSNAQPKVDAKLLEALDGYLQKGLESDYGLIDPAGLKRDLALTPFEELVDPDVWVQGPPFMIDVSEPKEFSQGSIGKAINMPFRTIPDSQEMIPWTTPTVVVCGVENHLTTLDRTYKYIVTICPNGHRAAIGMMMLQLLGFRDVHALQGGLKAWKAAGNP